MSSIEMEIHKFYPRDHLFSTYAKCYENLTFINPWYACVCARNNVKNLNFLKHFASQPAITCSQLTTETREQGVKYLQS